MKKLLITIIVIIGIPLYVLFSNKQKSASVGLPTSSTTSSSYKDGEYTGTSEDAYYGYIQVKAVVQNGKISDVQFLSYPNDRHESIEINDSAMPQLTQEAISAQTASVDTVSGATDTSEAFVKSLSSALSQAKS